MKIAIISFSHAESSLVLAKYLVELGHIVDYYYITRLGQIEAPAFPFGMKAKSIGLYKIPKDRNERVYNYFNCNRITINLITLIRNSSRYPWIEKPVISNVCSKIRKGNYEAINLIGQNELLLYFHKFLINNNIIHSLHEVVDHYETQKLDNKLLSYLIENKKPIIVFSSNSFEKLKNIVDVDMINNKIKIIPFGLFETYRLFNDEKNETNFMVKEPYMLFFGLIKSYKGLRVLYDAVQKLPSDFKFKFVVAGEGADDILQDLIKDNRFILINRRLSNDEICNLNKNAYCVICPYTSASQSGIVATTFLFEKPIVASSVGAFPEFVKNQMNGLLINPNDSEDLKIKLIEISENIELYNRLIDGTRNFPFAVNWMKIAEETIKFYQN